MISAIHFGIGFLLYVGFCLITFNVYSKKDEMTKFFVLGMIYLYYSILAVYVINLVEINGTLLEIIIESLIYLIACAIILVHHYKTNIQPKDKKMFGNNY